MSDAVALPLALLVLAATLAIAVLRPSYVTEAVAAVLGAAVLLAVGAIGLSRAWLAVRQLGPTVGFLAALLLIAEGCRQEGLFEAIGDLIARRARADSVRLLALVFVVASAVTIVLGLDATVVLLPPVVLVSVARLRAEPKGPVYAIAHLANSASLLLPVSNLTNLLAFRASGLSFVHFALLMALPTVAAVAVEWVVLSRRFGSPAPLRPVQALSAPGRPLPPFALTVLALTLTGFAVSSLISIAPVWIAVAGAVTLNLPSLASGRGTPATLVRAVEPGFLIFVLGLGVIVAAAGIHGLSSGVRHLLPAGDSLPDLLAIAAVSAVLANVVNNLPATLILLPVVAGPGSGPVLRAGPVLAVLIGVNVGPNLTQVGSLATLLWRRILQAEGVELDPREFISLGLVTVPPALVLCPVALWVGLRV